MKETMKMALDAANKAMKDASKCIEELGAKNKALKEALAEQHLQALHDENVRLGLYEQGYANAMNWKTENHLEHLPAKQEQGEPVAWMDIENGTFSGLRYWSEPDNRHEVALYTTPQQRTWVDLTDEEFQWCNDENWPMVRVAEMLKEKNT